MMTTSTPLRLALDEAGSEASSEARTTEPALLCVPGWCGDRSVFAPLLPLAARHRRILSVDLPAHGGSDGSASDLDSRAVVDALVDTVERSGVRQVVPLALSHAGWFAIELRRRLGPERVPALVLMDWMVLGPPPGFVDALAGLQDPAAWQEVRSGLFEMWTSGLDLPQLHAYVAAMGEYGFDHWSRAGREISASFAAEGNPLAALVRLDDPCPTLHVYAQPADAELLAAQRAFASRCPWFSVRHLDAASHFPTFEQPQQIVASVEEFLCRTR